MAVLLLVLDSSQLFWRQIWKRPDVLNFIAFLFLCLWKGVFRRTFLEFGLLWINHGFNIFIFYCFFLFLFLGRSLHLLLLFLFAVFFAVCVFSDLWILEIAFFVYISRWLFQMFFILIFFGVDKYFWMIHLCFLLFFLSNLWMFFRNIFFRIWLRIMFFNMISKFLNFDYLEGTVRGLTCWLIFQKNGRMLTSFRIYFFFRIFLLLFLFFCRRRTIGFRRPFSAGKKLGFIWIILKVLNFLNIRRILIVIFKGVGRKQRFIFFE